MREQVQVATVFQNSRSSPVRGQVYDWGTNIRGGT